MRVYRSSDVGGVCVVEEISMKWKDKEGMGMDRKDSGRVSGRDVGIM